MELKKVKAGTRYIVQCAFGDITTTCVDNGFGKDGKRLRSPMAGRFKDATGRTLYVDARRIVGPATRPEDVQS